MSMLVKACIFHAGLYQTSQRESSGTKSIPVITPLYTMMMREKNPTITKNIITKPQTTNNKLTTDITTLTHTKKNPNLRRETQASDVETYQLLWRNRGRRSRRPGSGGI